MNLLIAKRALLFSLIFGAFVGLVSLIPALIGLCLFVIAFLSAPIIILFMKKNDKHLGIINNEQGAILGGIAGFFTSVGFFISFSPMVCILKLIIKSYYAYMIPDMIKDALWLFVIVVLMVALVYAATNAASGMGVAWLMSHFEKVSDTTDNAIDIEIDN